MIFFSVYQILSILCIFFTYLKCSFSVLTVVDTFHLKTTRNTLYSYKEVFLQGKLQGILNYWQLSLLLIAERGMTPWNSGMAYEEGLEGTYHRIGVSIRWIQVARKSITQDLLLSALTMGKNWSKTKSVIYKERAVTHII